MGSYAERDSKRKLTKGSEPMLIRQNSINKIKGLNKRKLMTLTQWYISIMRKY